MTGHEIFTMNSLKELKKKIDAKIPYKIKSEININETILLTVVETYIDKNSLIGKTDNGIELFIAVADGNC